MNVLHSPEIISALSQLAQFLRIEKDPEQEIEGVLLSLQQRLGFVAVQLLVEENNNWKLRKERGKAPYFDTDCRSKMVEHIERSIATKKLLSVENIYTRFSIRADGKGELAMMIVPFAGAEKNTVLLVYRRNARISIVQQDNRILEVIRSLSEHSISRWLLQKKEGLPDTFRKPKTLIGSSEAMLDLYELLSHVVSSNTTVMISGESGTGKELIAHAIHLSSDRVKKTFVKVNCAALPEAIIESELFGHERGAFTGATGQRKGRFELADGGTLFLDEIGELSLGMQVKLLRVIQEREFERVGGTQTIQVNVRIVTATSRDLWAMTQAGTFRLDLYYRLHVFPIQVPPLRKRGEDIVLLAHHFAKHFASVHGKEIIGISMGAADLLRNHSWPGNVRELENCMERAILLTSTTEVLPHTLPVSLQRSKNDPKSSGLRLLAGMGLKVQLEKIEQQLIRNTIQECSGNMAKAARKLQLTERMMGLRVRKYQINWKSYRNHQSTKDT